MDEIEQLIRERALLRLADIFKVPVATLTPEHRFGDELKASFVSDFRRNEFDHIDPMRYAVASNREAMRNGCAATLGVELRSFAISLEVILLLAVSLGSRWQGSRAAVT